MIEHNMEREKRQEAVPYPPAPIGSDSPVREAVPRRTTTMAAAMNREPNGRPPRPFVEPIGEKWRNIPATMAALVQFVCWQMVFRPSKGKPNLNSKPWTKRPIQPGARKGGRFVSASSTDLLTWGTIAQALKFYQEFCDATEEDRLDGIGFVFAEGGGIIGIDLDECIVDGSLEPWAADIIEALGVTYWEISPSRRGLKGFYRGILPPRPGDKTGGTGRNKRLKLGSNGSGGIELYGTGRFFTTTGEAYKPPGRGDDPVEVQAIDSEGLTILLRMLDEPSNPQHQANNSTLRNGDEHHSRAGGEIDDAIIIERASAATNGAEFRAYYHEGSFGHHDSQSSADLALLSKLAWWTNGNTAQMERIFSGSALGQRAKWTERPYYRERTIAKSLEGFVPGSGYAPQAKASRIPPRDERDETDPSSSSRPTPRDVGASKGSLDSQLAWYKRTELGNAERFVARYGKDLHYCHPWKKWLFWDGSRWCLDNTGNIWLWACNTVRAMLQEAVTIDDSDARKSLVAWQHKSEEKKKVSAMLAFAESRSGIPILPEQMDRDPWLFNCRNGTIDLKTGDLLPHNRDDLITKLCPHRYIPAAKCPLFEMTRKTFFHRDDPAMQAALDGYFQKIGGQALTGLVDEHHLPILHGDGANGKSTILGAMLDTWGPDYAMKANADLLMLKKGETHSTEKTDLFGKRLVVAIEADQDRRLNESFIKELTGGDKIRARRMREDNWEFHPTHKVFLAVNHEPQVRGTDNGIWRRLKKIPFTVSMPDGKADKAMPRKLLKEAEGILAWFVQGCLAWQREGLEPPTEVLEATAEYRAKQDTIGIFLADCTLQGPSHKVRAGDLYKRYEEWAHAGNERVESQKAFGGSLQKRGFQTIRSGGVWYLNIGLAPKGDGLADLKQWLQTAISTGLTSVGRTVDAAGAEGLLNRLPDGELAVSPIFEAARALGYRTEGPDGSKVWVKIEEVKKDRSEELL